jgi:hypothetical protein
MQVLMSSGKAEARGNGEFLTRRKERAFDMNEKTTSWKSILRTSFRLLTFRSTREELLSFGWKHLAFGLFCAWLVGMGRFWDNPRVSWLQHLGVGSVIYVFALALLLYFIVWPLRPKDWSFFRVLTFVSLVSPPAILYAVPVERFFNLDVANGFNAWFLAIVAAWRVALLVFYLKRSAALDWLSVVTAALLPLTLIVVTLLVLNLDRVVFDFMGGSSSSHRSGNDTAYGVLFLLTFLSAIIFVPTLICYVVLASYRYVGSRGETTRSSD